MIWMDYVIIATIFFSTLVSLIRGFVHEILSLITWSCAFFISNHYYNYLSIYLIAHFETESICNAISIVLLFLFILIIGTYINYIIRLLLKRTGLSLIDQVLGICFGALRGIVIDSAALYFFDRFTNISHNQDWQNSYFIQKFDKICNNFF